MRAPLKDGRILITGASSGIGRALAYEVAAEAKSLVLIARRQERLQQIADDLKARHANLQVQVHACDLLDREALKATLKKIGDDGDVDILINNAGFGDIGLYEFSDWDKIERMIHLNVTALSFLCHHFVPSMVAKKRGGILNISSGFGLSVTPGVAPYAGTKHYVTAFTEGLRMELAGAGVVVTQVCPGPVDTEFEQVAGNPTGLDVPKFVQITPEHCARSAIRGFRRGRALVFPGFVFSCLMLANALTPRFLQRPLLSLSSSYLRKRQSSKS